MLLLDLDWD